MSLTLVHVPFVFLLSSAEGSLSRIYNDYSRAGKRARFLVDESDEDDEMEGDALTYQKIEFSFEDLCGEGASVQTESESWGLLGDTILARVFHFLRSDLRSLAFSAATCKCWSTAVKFYRDISRQVDLSSMGSDCTDSMFQNIMVNSLFWALSYLPLAYLCRICRATLLMHHLVLLGSLF